MGHWDSPSKRSGPGTAGSNEAEPVPPILAKFSINPIALHEKKLDVNRPCPSNFADVPEPLLRRIIKNTVNLLFAD